MQAKPLITTATGKEITGDNRVYEYMSRGSVEVRERAERVHT